MPLPSLAPKLALSLAIATAAAPLASCASVAGAPPPAFSAQQEDAELAAYTGPDAIGRYERCADKIACRNTLIDARVRAVDLTYYRFQRRSHRQEARAALGSDAAAMALDTLAAATGVGPLAAGAKLFTGGRDAFEQRVVGAAAPSLTEEVLARRRTALLRIREGERLPEENYTLFQALADISAYEAAGSTPGAAAALGAEVGAQAQAARARLEAFQTARAGTTPAAPPGATSPAP